MGRIKAALVHLLLSILVFSIFLSLVYFVWYPSPFNYTQGISEVVYLMAGIDIILGPLLTLVIFNAAKKGLKFDLAVIAFLQLGALIYGGYIIYSERPAWITFANDQFEVIRIHEIDQSQLIEKNLRIGIFNKPKEIYVVKPKGEMIKELVRRLLSEGKGREREPTLYRAFEQHIDTAFKQSKLFSKHSLLSKKGKTDEASTEPDIRRWMPVIGKIKDVVAIIDAEKKSVEYLTMEPFPSSQLVRPKH